MEPKSPYSYDPGSSPVGFISLPLNIWAMEVEQDFLYRNAGLGN